MIENPALLTIDHLVSERYVLLKKLSEFKLSTTEEKLLREVRIFLNIHNDFVTAYFYQTNYFINHK